MIVQRSFVALLAFAVLGLMVASPASAAESKTPGWYFSADVGGVWTGGNSQSSAIGAAAEIRRIWPRAQAWVSGAASQTETTKRTRYATGTVDDFEVGETEVTDKTAEFYNVTAAGLYDISDHFFALGGVDWMRNRPAGIDSRTLLALGAGNAWWDRDDSALRTFYNFTYTFQEDVVENPFVKADFPGLQFGYDYRQQITASTKFLSDALVDFNLDNSDDVRVNWYGALPVSINSRMELKPSLRVLWRNDPSLEKIDLVDPVTLDPTGDMVLTPLDEFDTIFTLALVIKFEPDQEG